MQMHTHPHLFAQLVKCFQELIAEGEIERGIDPKIMAQALCFAGARGLKDAFGTRSAQSFCESLADSFGEEIIENGEDAPVDKPALQ